MITSPKHGEAFYCDHRGGYQQEITAHVCPVTKDLLVLTGFVQAGHIMVLSKKMTVTSRKRDAPSQAMDEIQ